jgi:DNA-binding NarL/FixJ family response regulator
MKQEEISVLMSHVSALSCELWAEAFTREGFNVAGRALTSSEVVDVANSARVDVALIWVRLQDGALSGFEALRRLRESRPNVRSVMLLESPDAALVIDSFRAGARGIFCPSQSEFKMLCRCVKQVHAGQIWANTVELGFVMEAIAQLAPLRVVDSDGMQLLAKREQDVVRLVAEGLSNREVARELGLSEHTVKNYLFHIFDKLGVSSRVELVLYAVSSTRRSGVSEESPLNVAVASSTS